MRHRDVPLMLVESSQTLAPPALWFFFFFNDTAPTEIYTLSLHDALPISLPRTTSPDSASTLVRRDSTARATSSAAQPAMASRSEEHTSELQSRLHLVCRLLLEKKKPPLLKRMVLAGMNDPKSGKCLSHYS